MFTLCVSPLSLCNLLSLEIRPSSRNKYSCILATFRPKIAQFSPTTFFRLRRSSNAVRADFLKGYSGNRRSTPLGGCRPVGTCGLRLNKEPFK
jgi:hypothetical protein